MITPSQPQDEYRGSRRHILTLTDAQGTASRITQLLDGTGIVVHDSDHWQPQGFADAGEMDLPTFLTSCNRYPEWSKIGDIFRPWWAPNGGRLPQWDLLATCTIDATPGLLLVEAKAHESELSFSGKPQPDADASQGSRDNDDCITRAIAEASAGLNQLLSGVTLSCRSHYQLANRLTWAWKVATCGIPVALLYLGFIGDTYFADDFRTSDHWQRMMGGYLQGVVPLMLPDHQFAMNGIPFCFLVRSF